MLDETAETVSNILKIISCLLGSVWGSNSSLIEEVK